MVIESRYPQEHAGPDRNIVWTVGIEAARHWAAICVIDPTHQGQVNVVGRRPAAHHAATNSGARKISAKAVIAAQQFPAPQSVSPKSAKNASPMRTTGRIAR
jgi:hypothetical protein